MHHYNLNIGNTCVWYNQADTNTDPYAAIVTDTNGRGMLSLQLISPSGGLFKMLRGVRHISDNELDVRPNVKVALGAWDFAAKIVQDPIDTSTEQESVELTMEQCEKIMAMADSGMPAVDIARRIWKKGWTAAKIATFIEKQRALEEANAEAIKG